MDREGCGNFRDRSARNLRSYEICDMGRRKSSLALLQHQLAGLAISVDGDLVTCLPTDPNEGLLTYRWFWGTDTPEYTARKVALADVNDIIPPDEPRITADQRRSVVRSRRSHVAWRFRT